MNIFVKVLIGVVVGAAVAIVYGVITKNNIVQKIKEALAKKKSVQNKVHKKATNAFAALVKEIQKDSVNVDVFFGKTEDAEIEEVKISGKAKDIREGEWISLVD